MLLADAGVVAPVGTDWVQPLVIVGGGARIGEVRMHTPHRELFETRARRNLLDGRLHRLVVLVGWVGGALREPLVTDKDELALLGTL